MFIDVHCHLEMLGDIDKIVKNAKEKGVGKIVTAGTDIKTNRFALTCALKYKEIGCVLGIYPDDALKMSDKEIDKEIEFIKKNKEKIIGIGEVGMDFKNTLDKEKRKKQEETFRKFVSLAIELDKPIIVHSRQAEKECIDILEEMKSKKVIMHCFFGELKLVKRIIKNKWYLSIPTCVKNNKHFWNVIRVVET